MNLGELPSLVLDNVIFYLNPIDILFLARANASLYSFLRPYCDQLPTLKRIFEVTEKQITDFCQNQSSEFETFAFNDGWSENYAHLGFLMNMIYNVFTFEKSFNLFLHFKFLRSNRVRSYRYSFPDFLENEKVNNIKTFYQPEQICLLLNKKGIIIKVPSLEAQIIECDFDGWNAYANRKFGTVVDGCCFIDSHTLHIYKKGVCVDIINLPVSVFSYYHPSSLSINDQYSFIIETNPFHLINYKQKTIIQQQIPKGVWLIDGIMKFDEKYYVFQKFPSTINVFHMNHTITHDNTWIWKKVHSHKIKKKSLDFFVYVYCPIFNKIYEFSKLST